MPGMDDIDDDDDDDDDDNAVLKPKNDVDATIFDHIGTLYYILNIYIF